jgi:GNAT superfamily N-acetyltransferase
MLEQTQHGDFELNDPKGLQTSVLIRPLLATDSISKITQLLHAAYRPLLEQGMRYTASHQDDQTTWERCIRGDTFIAELDGEIIGTITLSSIQNTKGSPWYDRPDVASFGQFGVHPSLQRLKIGSILLDRVENRASELGIRHLALDTSENATHLIRYYESRGYRFVEYTQWATVNYRSVIMSKML